MNEKVASANTLSRVKCTVWRSVITQRGGMGGEEGGSRRRRYMYNYGRFASLYGRNQHNIVKIKKTNRRSRKAIISLIVTFVTLTTKALRRPSPGVSDQLPAPPAQGKSACGKPWEGNDRNPTLKDSPLSLAEPRNPPLGKARRMASGANRGPLTSRYGRTFDVSFLTFQHVGS